MNIDVLYKKLKQSKLDAAIFFSSENSKDVNFDYFSDFKNPTFSFLVVCKKSFIAASSIDYERALEESSLDVIKLKDYKYNLKKIIKEKTKAKKIGILFSSIPYSIAKSLRGYKLVSISEQVQSIRAIKSKKEISYIKRACEIANKCIKHIEKEFSNFTNEKEIFFEIKNVIEKKKGDGFSFDPIIASGNRSAIIHPYPSFSNKKISKGLGLIDFGVKYKGYCSDVTLPFSVGSLNKKQKVIVEAVLDAYGTCKDMLKDGQSVSEVFKVAEKTINKHGFEFKHAAGHGIGLEVHDPPSLSIAMKSERLKKYMTVTLEPGVYETDIGGCRLENDFLISKKPVVLTKSEFKEF
ncbi:MAG: Xaa-Pro peptidase family protein [Candidatus Aenigmarchaeota archaeon]|nr:Xaa-Pro peptidase family protein [Candidatus Aenigmarchaeota archaeon]